MDRNFTIGELASFGGCNVQTVRYYEQVGLMPRPVRTAGRQRRYDRDAAERLGFIRHARGLGFSVEAIRELLALADDPDGSCERAGQIALAQVDAIEKKILRLEALRSELKRLIRRCRMGKVADCQIIRALFTDELEGISSRPRARRGVRHVADRPPQ